MKKALCILTFLLLLPACGGGQEVKVITHEEAPKSLLEAVEVAKRLLGLEGKYTAEKVTMKHCIVPFVRKQVIGKSAWKITVGDVKLKFRRGDVEEEHENPYIREPECIILAETGQLLQIESKIPKGMTIKPDRIPVEQAERRYGSEKIKGLPAAPSQLSFKEVLQRAFEERGEWVSTAKQVVAFYVIDAYGQNEEIRPPQPLWLIHVRGFSPPFPPSAFEQAEPIDYMRMLFTGDGKARGGGNMLAPK